MMGKKKQKDTLEGNRILDKNIPNLNGQTDGSGNIEPMDGYSMNGWVAAGNKSVIYETYFDMSGYFMKDLSFIPSVAVIQDPGMYTCSDTDAPAVIIMDIISQERLSEPKLFEAYSNNQAPAGPITDQDWNNITFGKHRLMLNTQQFKNTGIYTVAQEKDFGSGDVSTAQKLWIYRYINYGQLAASKVFTVPAARFILTGMLVHETDLVYLQRLKRTYETQGAV